MAKVIVSDNLGNKHTLTIFQPILSHIIDSIPGKNDMETKLLMAPKLKFRITSNKVVFAVEQL